MGNEALTKNVLAAALVEAAVGAGIDRSHLEAAVAETDPEDAIALQTALWRTIVTHAGPEAGVRVGASFRIDHLGGFGFVLGSSATVGQALGALSQYGAQLDATFRPAVVITTNDAKIELDPPPEIRALEHPIAAYFAAIATMGSHLIGRKFPVRYILRSTPRDPCSVALGRLLDTPVLHDQPRDAMVLARETLLLSSMPNAPTHLRPLLERELRVGPAPKRNVADAIRQILAPGVPADPSTMARRLGMSRRTLQRSLAQEGVTLSALIAQNRRDEACRLLTTMRGPLKEVARRVGYTDVAAFCRAFRRWTGQSPGQFHLRAVARDAPNLTPAARQVGSQDAR